MHKGFLVINAYAGERMKVPYFVEIIIPIHFIKKVTRVEKQSDLIVPGNTLADGALIGMAGLQLMDGQEYIVKHSFEDLIGKLDAKVFANEFNQRSTDDTVN